MVLWYFAIFEVSAKRMPQFRWWRRIFFFEKKKWSLILASIHSTIETQVSHEVNGKDTKAINLTYLALKDNQYFSHNQLYPFLDIADTNGQVITRFNIIICCLLFLEKWHLRYKRLGSIFNQRRASKWSVEHFFPEITSSFKHQTSWLKRHLSRNVLRHTLNWFFLWYSYHGSASPFSSMPQLLLKAMFTLYRIAFAPARKPNRIRLIRSHIRTVISALFLSGA